VSAKTITTLAGSLFLMTVLQLVSGLANSWAALICAALLAPLALGIFRFFETETAGLGMLFAIPCGASAVGVAVVFLAVRQDPLLLLAPVIAAAVAGIIEMARRMSSRRCQLCNGRIGGAMAFACPRCGLLVCEQQCWSFEHCRCRLCEQNRVPVFPPDGRWWDHQLGPRSPHGRCQLCLASAEETDLRVCGKCGRPQCRDCWDYANGQCTRCQWTIADLPESLRPFAVAAPAAHKSAGR